MIYFQFSTFCILYLNGLLKFCFLIHELRFTVTVPCHLTLVWKMFMLLTHVVKLCELRENSYFEHSFLLNVQSCINYKYIPYGGTGTSRLLLRLSYLPSFMPVRAGPWQQKSREGSNPLRWDAIGDFWTFPTKTMWRTRRFATESRMQLECMMIS